MNQTVQRHLFISGRVQGVFFRNFTQQTALERDLTGWVRNLPDGRVEAVLEGTPSAVAAVEQALGEGPSQARVDNVVGNTESPAGHDGFRVR